MWEIGCVEREYSLIQATVTRQQAISAGSVTYFTGKLCKNGHLALRNTKGRGCQQCNVESLRAYYAADPVAAKKRWREQSKQKKAKNPEAVKKCGRLAMQRLRARKPIPERREAWRNEYYARLTKDPDKFLAARKAYVRKHSAYFRVRAANRRAIIAKAGGSLTTEEVLRMYEAQDGLCAHDFCRKELSTGYHMDHIIPLAIGGSGGKENIQLLCPPCNLSKGAKHPDVFAEEMRGRRAA